MTQVLDQLTRALEGRYRLERMLRGPSWLSVHTLRLDPIWDPIRDHPRFRALLTRNAPR